MASVPKKSAAVQVAASVAEPVPPAPETGETTVAAAVEPIADFQEGVRSALETGVTETRAAFGKAKTAADQAASAVEASFAAAKDGVLAINAKALEALRANVEANLDFVKSAFAVKSMSDLVALQGEFVRKQVEALTGQTKELGALAQKVMTESATPLKEQVAKSFKSAV